MKKRQHAAFMAAFYFGITVLPLSAQGAEVVSKGYVAEETVLGPDAGGVWKEDAKGWWFEHADQSYTVNNWEEIKDVWYYFDAEGYMLRDCWLELAGVRYRFNSEGGMLASREAVIDGVTYTFDESGAATAVTPPKSEAELAAEAIAADVVGRITNDGMTKPQKANAIYDWVRGNMSYSHSGPKGDPAEGALYGFRRRYGNCYEYYAMSKYLLDAAGMPNIMVTRASDGDHFWNLVDVDGVWYHFDTTPRSSGGRWCLVTTATLQNTWGAHNFDVGAYPKTP